MADSTGLYAILTAGWLGILTSISPCPLASNITALFYITGSVGGREPGRVLFKGALYATGRSIAYVSVAGLLAWGVLSVPTIANFLQTYMNQLLGPVLLVIGFVLMSWLKLPGMGHFNGNKIKDLADRAGTAGAVLLGFIFALSFCPVSAGLFFGGLIPLALANQSPVVMPAFYGLGTALPVIAVAIMISVGMDVTGRLFSITKIFDVWARRFTALIFFATGGYYTWNFLLSSMIKG
ncbi:MAG: aromatic aminobenezylarsenical efflux permease ArsG family transporter [Dissulfurimicrobium sp.]|uniref:aromatic aminobenezylarsenical efflux permease ArsG family transporter n=1 Tax=Dissulfurimicrobium sp. TaxID=2022436 RepID=UPI00404AF749